MRNIVLAGPTMDKALGLVRLGRLKVSPTNVCQLLPGECATRQEELLSVLGSVPSDLANLLDPRLPAPVHLYVSRASGGFSSKKVSFHVLSSPLPLGAFSQLCEGVLVPSWPLYYVLRCAKMKSLSGRLKLGMKLCGSYAHLVPGDESTDWFYREPNKKGKLEVVYHNPRIRPAMSVNEVASFLSSVRYLRGSKSAREAVRLLTDGAASPAEAVLGLMMGLPCKEGGYGFKGIELNPKAPVPQELRSLVSAETYHPDCYLPTIEVDLEMQSYENHSGKRALVHDASRRNDIQTLGIEVRDVTWDCVSHLDKFDKLALQLVQREKERGIAGAFEHGREIKHPDNRAKRRVRLNELLPPWPYEK